MFSWPFSKSAICIFPQNFSNEKSESLIDEGPTASSCVSNVAADEDKMYDDQQKENMADVDRDEDAEEALFALAADQSEEGVDKLRKLIAERECISFEARNDYGLTPLQVINFYNEPLSTLIKVACFARNARAVEVLVK